MHSFAQVLSDYQRRSGRSQRSVATAAGLDPGRYSRLLSGERHPVSREQVVALAAALRLSTHDTDILVAAAGFLPPSLERAGPADPAVAALLDALADPEMDDASRGHLQQTIVAIATHWQRTRTRH